MAVSGLVQVVQEDWAAGMVRSVAPHLIPENGVFNALNGLLDEDGSIYGRAGTEYLTNASIGDTAIRLLWSGELTAGYRTVFATSDAIAVVGADGATPVTLRSFGVANPTRAHELLGLLFIEGVGIYGGARSTSNASGQATLTAGSATVTLGAAVAGMEAGMLLNVGGRALPIKTVNSTTQVVLRDSWDGTSGAQAYSLSAIAPFAPLYQDGVLSVVIDRLTSSLGSRMKFSETGKPHSSIPDDYHELPGGVKILGADSISDVALQFATDGIWVVSNMGFDLTDEYGNPQQRLERVNRELVLWSAPGITGYRDGLVVPSADGVWLLGQNYQTTPVSQSINPLYREYVRSGHKTGVGVVHNNHYFLPILTGVNTPVETLVCRLDRSVQTRLGVIYPWSRIDNAGLTAVVNRVEADRSVTLIGGTQDGRVVRCPFFEPSAENKMDADGSWFRWETVTRDYATGKRNENKVRGLEVRYEMEDAENDNPEIVAAIGTGVRADEAAARWDEAVWDEDDFGEETKGDFAEEFAGLEGAAPESDGTITHYFPVNERRRFARIALNTTGPVARLVLRELALHIRPSRKS